MPENFVTPELPAPADDEETDRIYAKYAGIVAGDSQDLAESGFKIARYVNAEVRARGGMGRVFVAYDPDLGRNVALKALPVGLSPDEARARVPRAEGKALAHIDHPNVVRVLDLVQHRGLSCLVLEYIEGLDLGEWLKATRPGWRGALAKFLLAGEGLAAVHAAGLIHRDFKPANVVVGREGVVKLIDFGLARTLNAVVEDEKERPGTPRYMAPEQMSGGQADARADQFSFCVALYEALFGAHPYLSNEFAASAEQHGDQLDRAAEEATARTIADNLLGGAPRHPERLPPGLPPTILPAVLRGLSPEPGRRFASMRDLLAQLRRDPRETRRRVLVAVAGVLTVTAALAAIVRPEACPSIEAEQTRAWGGLRDAVAARLAPYGSGPLDTLDGLVDQLATARSEACDARVRGEHQATDLARDVCLQTREVELGSILQQIDSSDDEQRTRLVGTLSEWPTAKVCSDPAQLRYSCAEDETSAANRARGAAALLAGDFERAEELGDAALAMAERSGAIGSRASAQILLGRIAYDRGEWRSAERMLEGALDLAEPNACFAPAADAYHWLVKLGAFDEQIPIARAEQYSRYQDYRSPAADRTARAAVLNNRALLAERRSGDLPRAEQLLREAIALREPEFDDTVGQADSYLNLASVLFAAGATEQAQEALKAAEQRRTTAVGARHPDHAKELRNFGLIELRSGHHAAAIAMLTRALERARAGLGGHAPILGEIYIALASAHDLAGDESASLAASRAAQRVYERLSADDLRRSEGLEAVGQALLNAEQFAEALRPLEAAEAQLSASNAAPARRGTVDFKIGEARNGQGEYADAEVHARRALEHFDAAGLAADADFRAHAGLILGEALLGQQRWRDAVPPLEQAAAIWRASGANPERLAWAVWGLTKCICRLPDRPDLREAHEEGLRAIPLIESDPARHLSRRQELDSICRPR